MTSAEGRAELAEVGSSPKMGLKVLPEAPQGGAKVGTAPGGGTELEARASGALLLENVGPSLLARLPKRGLRTGAVLDPEEAAVTAGEGWLAGGLTSSPRTLDLGAERGLAGICPSSDEDVVATLLAGSSGS